MACSLKNDFSAFGSGDTLVKSKTKGFLGLRPSIGSLHFTESSSKNSFMGEPLHLLDLKTSSNRNPSPPASLSVQGSISVSRALRWWEKTLTPNLVEIHTAQELVDSLVNAGDRLVIVDFYSPGCGGCKALHPKICQLAEAHPNALFLKVNHEQLKAMCYCLRIHVLPFFRLYRGSQGRLCSFSCTNATIKKFKDALAKYGRDQGYSSGPAKGLDESELLSLAAIGQIPLNWPSKSIQEDELGNLILNGLDLSSNLCKTGKEDNSLLMA